MNIDHNTAPIPQHTLQQCKYILSLLKKHLDLQSSGLHDSRGKYLCVIEVSHALVL